MYDVRFWELYEAMPGIRKIQEDTQMTAYAMSGMTEETGWRIMWKDNITADDISTKGVNNKMPSAYSLASKASRSPATKLRFSI
jgi:hypothetical protein